MSQGAGAQQALGNAQGQLGGGVPGGHIVNAALPIFQRNLQLGADTLRQAGPRFASGTEHLVAQQGQQAMQDFNLFAEQSLLKGREQALQEILGGGQLDLQRQGLNLSAIMPLLQTALTAGGATSAPIINQSKGFLQGTLLPILGTAAQIGATAGFGPLGGAAVGAGMGMLGGSGPNFNPTTGLPVGFLGGR